MSALFTEKNAKTGIAFGGGGTRGIAHIGVIRILQEYGVDFDFVAGNSAGALAGALYAAGVPWRKMYEFVHDIRNKIPRKSLLTYLNPQIIEDLADNFFKGADFSDLKKPFCAVAVDLESGTLETLARGNLSKALSASCAVPGVFHPVKIGGKTYIDGGTLRSIPTEAVREMGAERVVGVDLNSDRSSGTRSTRRFNVLITAYKLNMSVNSRFCERYADIMLRPWLENYPLHSFKSVTELLKIGEKTALESLGRIKELTA